MTSVPASRFDLKQKGFRKPDGAKKKRLFPYFFIVIIITFCFINETPLFYGSIESMGVEMFISVPAFCGSHSLFAVTS